MVARVPQPLGAFFLMLKQVGVGKILQRSTLLEIDPEIFLEVWSKHR